FEVVEVPAEYKDAVEKARHELIEQAVTHDEATIEKYLSGAELTNDEIRHAVRASTVGGFMVPVLCGASFKNKGVQALLAAAIGLKDTRTGDTMCDDDHPIILEAMKFPAPVIDVAIEPKTKADQDKLSIALAKLSEEDPTFRVHTDAETSQTIISGMGELHLEIIVERMRREFKVDANVGRPQVAYRETVRKRVEYIEGKFIRQTGGRGQYGH